MTLLHVAAMFNAVDIALMLIDAGASPDAINAQGETVLSTAHAHALQRAR